MNDEYNRLYLAKLESILDDLVALNRQLIEYEKWFNEHADDEGINRCINAENAVVYLKSHIVDILED